MNVSGRIAVTGAGVGFGLAALLWCEARVRQEEVAGAWLKPGVWKPLNVPVVAGQALGWRTVTADLLWMRAIQYLGDIRNAPAQYPKFEALVKDVVRADPSCVQAYESGSAALMWVVKNPPAALALLKEGIQKHPRQGRLSVYLAAFTYYQSDRYSETIGLLETMVEQEEHPPMLELILGNLYLKVGDREKAGKFWWWMWYHSRSEENRREARTQLQQHGFWEP